VSLSPVKRVKNIYQTHALYSWTSGIFAKIGADNKLNDTELGVSIVGT